MTGNILTLTIICILEKSDAAPLCDCVRSSLRLGPRGLSQSLGIETGNLEIGPWDNISIFGARNWKPGNWSLGQYLNIWG